MAKKHGKKQQNLRPSATLSPIQQAKRAFQRSDYNLAIDLLEEFDGDKSALAEIYFRRAQKNLFQSPTQATADLVKAAELVPTDALYAYHAGLAYHREKDHAQALHWYREAFKRDSGFKRAALPLAIALLETGKKVEQDAVWALLDESQRLLLKADNAQDALSFIAQGDWAGAQTALEAMLARSLPPLAEAVVRYYLGVARHRQGDVTKALEYWQKAFNQGFDTPHLRENLALTYVQRAEEALRGGKLDEAQRYIQRGLEAAPDHPRLVDIHQYVALQNGYTFAEQGQWKKALAAWQSVKNAQGPNARGLAANTALALERLERWSEAADAWREFVKRRSRKETSEYWLSDQQVARLWERISALYIRDGNAETAISTLQNALKYQPDDVTLGLSLIRCYLEVGRIDAAYNQLDRVLKKHPQDVDALVLKAEMAENIPRRSPFPEMSISGIDEWKAVYATGDETYAPLAKQRLQTLYEELISAPMFWFTYDDIKRQITEALEMFPDSHYLRARLVDFMLQHKAKMPEVRAQIAKIDLTDQDALHQLIDAWHIAKRPEEAAALLTQAHQLKPLDADFYLGIAGCALHRQQSDIAQLYFDNAVALTANEDERKKVRSIIGFTFAQQGKADKAEAIWRDLLREDPAYGEAHLMLAVLEVQRQNVKAARSHLQSADKWARQHKDQEMLEHIESIRMLLDSPIPFMSGLNPFAPPPPFGNFDDFDDFDVDEFLDGFAFEDEDEEDEPPLLPPRRNKRK